jgi:hypothetical protein
MLVYTNWLFSFFFSLKTTSSGRLFLQGPSRDGLYPIYLSKSLNKAMKVVAFLGVDATSINRHRRLGYPTPPILNKLKQSIQLPITTLSNNQVQMSPFLGV